MALACDYDGTIAHHGGVPSETIQALRALKASGRRLLLVTGRELDDLGRVFPHLDLFDRIVAENGALVHDPVTRESRILAERPPDTFVQELVRRRIEPLSVGHVIVATWEPHDAAVLATIRDLGLELQVIFN
jgi:HAD superfamily hydrolase (TIGR01484 family)